MQDKVNLESSILNEGTKIRQVAKKHTEKSEETITTSNVMSVISNSLIEKTT